MTPEETLAQWNQQLEAVRAEVLKARQAFADDRLALYQGPLRDNEGNVVLKAGQRIDNEDNKYKLGVKFLVEGAIGNTGLAR